MKIINYVTKKTPYVDVLEKTLLPSIKKFNLDYHIEYIDDLGSWSANTNVKSQFILDCLNKFKEPVCFVDADGEFLKYPSLFDQLPSDFDIAFHLLNWFDLWRKQPENKSNMDLLSGTFCVNYTPKALAFMQRCIHNIKANPNKWEQITIQRTLDESPEIKVEYLPFSYCTVLLQNNTIPEHMIKKDDVVVLHHQASRQYKDRRKWANNLSTTILICYP